MLRIVSVGVWMAAYGCAVGMKVQGGTGGKRGKQKLFALLNGRR
jgi:hypothetical protein